MEHRVSSLVITGGSSGIGKATAELFASRGWRVYELSRSGKSSEGIVHIECDVTSAQSVQQAVEELLRHTSRLDVVISNAGMGISGPIEFAKEQDIRRQMDVNFMGAVHLVQAVLPTMRAQRGGYIFFTSSVAAVLSVPYQGFYSASKAAINAMALALANEVRAYNIRVSCLMPGDVATGFTDARCKSEASKVYSRSEKAILTMEKDERNGMSPEQMAKKFWRMAHRRYPAPTYVGGWLYSIFYALDCLLPKRFVNRIEGWMY